MNKKNPIKTLRLKRFAAQERVIGQEEMAEVLSISQSNMSMRENADLRKLNFGELDKLRDFFQFETIEEMLNWDPDAPIKPVKASTSEVAEPKSVYAIQQPRETIQLIITLDKTVESVNRAIDLINLNHKHLKST